MNSRTRNGATSGRRRRPGEGAAARPHGETQLARMQAIAALGSMEIDFGTGRVSVSDEARHLLGWEGEAVPSISLILNRCMRTMPRRWRCF